MSFSDTAPLPPASPPIAAFLSGFDGSPWAVWAGTGLTPRVVSPGTATQAHRDAFFRGVEILRIDKRGRGILPQQMKLVDCLGSGRRFAAVLLPRQSSKTTTIEAYLLGLCATMPGLKVGFFNCQTGKAARDHYRKEITPHILAQFPDPATAPLKAMRGAGAERVEFENGSLFQVLGSLADLRGSYFDIIWADEAGELEGPAFEEFESAALPTQDTRAGVVLESPLLVYSGTAGKSRVNNALWTYLERGREGDEDVAVLEYSAGIDVVIEDIETWDDASALLAKSHPGIDTLTTLKVLRANYKPTEKWMREYLGVFGSAGSTTGVISPAKWAEGEVNATPARPEWFVMGVMQMKNGGAASIVATWRVEGVAHVAVLDHREGVNWLAPKLVELAKANKHVPIVYDDFGPIRAEMQTAKRDYPNMRVVKLSGKDAGTNAGLLVKEIHTGNFRHYGQKALTDAALSARQRTFGTNAWAFAKPDLDADITAIEAAGYALITYDSTPQRKPVSFMFAA